jgi:hypothetical protein
VLSAELGEWKREGEFSCEISDLRFERDGDLWHLWMRFGGWVVAKGKPRWARRGWVRSARVGGDSG